jgi:hypothetical protein
LESRRAIKNTGYGDVSEIYGTIKIILKQKKTNGGIAYKALSGTTLN